ADPRRSLPDNRPNRPGGLSGWRVWRRAGPHARNGSADLFPLTAVRSFLARQEARLPPSSAHAAALTGAGRLSRRLKTAIEAASGGPNDSQEKRQWLRSAASSAATTASSPER